MQLEGTSNSVNQIPATASIRGDVRLTPFYSMDEMKSKMTQCVANLNGCVQCSLCGLSVRDLHLFYLVSLHHQKTQTVAH